MTEALLEIALCARIAHVFRICREYCLSNMHIHACEWNPIPEDNKLKALSIQQAGQDEKHFGIMSAVVVCTGQA